MGPAKTGWTLASQHTYAAAAVRDGRELQLIILHSQDKWRDATMLFDYGFAHLPPIPPPPVKTVAAPSPKPPANT
jgi:D-alanyl-D-alanine carboxypeptidase